MATGDRGLRQRDLVPPDRLASVSALVVGVGAIGRQVALQLAAMGVPELLLVDYDLVEEVNLGPQGYEHSDIGYYKSATTRKKCNLLNPEMKVEEYPTRFQAPVIDRDYLGKLKNRIGTVFCCVDRMDIRALVWKTVKAKADFFVDGRMNAETMRILASSMPRFDVHYETTLFADDDPDRAQGECTARSTIYTAYIASGLMVAQLARFLRMAPGHNDTELALNSMEISTT